MSKDPAVSALPLSEFAPKLSELTRQVLFGDVWERPELAKRDRSLITVAALIALDRPEQLRFHLGKALENGLKQEGVEFSINFPLNYGYSTANLG
jgi:4-carboxymuconolactone decarboxylase